MSDFTQEELERLALEPKEIWLQRLRRVFGPKEEKPKPHLTLVKTLEERE